MPKLNPEQQARRTEKFKATMAMKKAVQANRPQSVAEREMQEVTAAEVMAAKPIAAIKAANKTDPRLALVADIVALLNRVLR